MMKGWRRRVHNGCRCGWRPERHRAAVGPTAPGRGPRALRAEDARFRPCWLQIAPRTPQFPVVSGNCLVGGRFFQIFIGNYRKPAETPFCKSLSRSDFQTSRTFRSFRWIRRAGAGERRWQRGAEGAQSPETDPHHADRRQFQASDSYFKEPDATAPAKRGGSAARTATAPVGTGGAIQQRTALQIRQAPYARPGGLSRD